MKIAPREKRRHAAGREAWVDFHACSRFVSSSFPEEKWGTTRSLLITSAITTTRWRVVVSRLSRVSLLMPLPR